MDPLLSSLRALADPTRLRIMRLIGRMELSVGELALVLEQSQPRVSRHVRILSHAGLVERRREGSWVFLHPAGGELARALAALIQAAEPDIAARDRARLAEVREARATAARAWFEGNAERWDSIRSLYVPEAAVEAAMLRLLGPSELGRLLDVGTGTGRIAELMGTRASAIVALDNSPAMLRLARTRLQELSGCEVELRLGDFNSLPLPDRSMDTVLLHQVLHFADDPGHVIAEVARVMTRGGRLMVVDFAAHDREELRREHQHARLGFKDRSMSRWLSDAGLALTHCEALAGGELTVRIWLAAKPGDERHGRPDLKVAA